jgi:hypothetical protein
MASSPIIIQEKMQQGRHQNKAMTAMVAVPIVKYENPLIKRNDAAAAGDSREQDDSKARSRFLDRGGADAVENGGTPTPNDNGSNRMLMAEDMCVSGGRDSCLAIEQRASIRFNQGNNKGSEKKGTKDKDEEGEKKRDEEDDENKRRLNNIFRNGPPAIGDEIHKSNDSYDGLIVMRRSSVGNQESSSGVREDISYRVSPFNY